MNVTNKCLTIVFTVCLTSKQIQSFLCVSLSVNKMEEHKPFTLQDITQEHFTKYLLKTATAIAKYTNEPELIFYSLNANQDFQ